MRKESTLVSNALKEYNKLYLFYEPSIKQKSFHHAGSGAFERLFLAGNRTGKTYCGCVEDAMHLTGNYPNWWEGRRFNHPIVAWVGSENYEITRDVIQLKLIGGFSQTDGFTNGLIPKELIVKKAMLAGVNGAVDYVHIKHKSGGVSSLYFKSYKQGREKFQGARCNLIHLDEEPPYDIYTECLMRLMSVDKKARGLMMLTLTPLKGHTQMMSYFLESTITIKIEGEKRIREEVRKNPPEVIDKNGRYYIQASWDDNPYLLEEDIISLRASLKPHELEAREKGIPSIGSGLVYPVPESEFLIEPRQIMSWWHKVYGLDVGFAAPTAAIFVAIDKDNDVVYVYAEYSDNRLTAYQHASKLMPMGADWMRGICDPAVNQVSQRDGETLLNDYKRAGLKLDLAKYAKEAAVDRVLERIREGRFKVFNTCTKFMDEWRKYHRDEDGKIQKGNDHLMNALEFVMTDGLRLARTHSSEDNFNYIKPARF